MIKARRDDIVFNLSAFRRRALAQMDRQAVSSATLSKRLFNGHAHALERIVEGDLHDAGKTFPRLDTLLKADKALTALEALPAEAGR